MELSKIRNAIIKKLWFIILVTFMCTGITVYVNYKQIKPTYQSELMIYVITKNTKPNASSLSLSDIQINNLLIRDYEEILVSNKIASQVVNKLRIKDITPSQLAGKLTIKLKNNSNIMRVVAYDSDPVRAMNIANTVGLVLKDEVVSLTGQDSINIYDAAQVSKYPVLPQKKKNIVISFLVSFLGSTLTVALVEFFKKKEK